uniref:Uncharacterized protein n=1 Tax=Arundo donax TaxID=35708 RepID=A0A0A8ZYD3_ARUDO
MQLFPSNSLINCLSVEVLTVMYRHMACVPSSVNWSVCMELKRYLMRQGVASSSSETIALLNHLIPKHFKSINTTYMYTFSIKIYTGKENSQSYLQK